MNSEKVHFILSQPSEKWTAEEIVDLLGTDKEGEDILFKEARKVKEKYVGKKVYFRGLIEFSNICSKNCYYCGIRKDNLNVDRYNLTDNEILDAVRFAYESQYGSIVIQGGELSTPTFTNRITRILKEIGRITNQELGVTLSLGEQPIEVYQEWLEAGAHRYLLRIESANPDLYYKIHPNDSKHSWERRLQALEDLQKTGYQTGTGVMIALPFQTLEDLAKDILFMRDFDIDMVGMGPYIEHKNTPLYNYRDKLLPIKERFQLALRMIAILRIVMKDINIASATALQAIDPMGREKALNIGANVIMPNVTPGMYRNNYKLYENKPCTDEEASDCVSCLDMRISLTGNEIGYGEKGDPLHFASRKK